MLIELKNEDISAVSGGIVTPMLVIEAALLAAAVIDAVEGISNGFNEQWERREQQDTE